MFLLNLREGRVSVEFWLLQSNISAGEHIITLRNVRDVENSPRCLREISPLSLGTEVLELLIDQLPLTLACQPNPLERDELALACHTMSDIWNSFRTCEEMAASDDGKIRYTADLLKIPGMSFDTTIDDPKERIQAYIDSYRDPGPGGQWGFEDRFMKDHIKIISATVSSGKATAIFEMHVATEFTNRMGNMMGGALAMVLDMCTTMCAAPLARDNFWVFGGVSRTLSMTYLRPVQRSMDLIIECEILQQGSRLSTIRGQVKDKKDGRLLSTCEHNKASIKFVDEGSKI